MNKKLFTLAAALMMGSAFTVNAQTDQAADKTALDGSTWYFIGTSDAAATRVFLGGNKITLTDASYEEAKVTIPVASVAGVENLPTGDAMGKYLWKVSKGTNGDGTFYYTFTNKLTEQKLTFDKDGEIIGENLAAGDGLKLTGLTWAGVNTDGTYKKDGGVITTKNSKQIKLVAGGVSINTGSTLRLYTIDAQTDGIVDVLNAALGGGFALSFPDVKPQPTSNIFDQKITAVQITNQSIAPAGTYFAVSMPAGGIKTANDFKASTFIAVSPTEHFGINALPQSDGVGFKFITVSGKNLKSGTTEKDQVNVTNAQFVVSVADPINKPNQYTIKVPAASVKLNASKDTQTSVPVYVDAITSVGVTYVTTTKEATKQKLVISETNMVKAADILSEDAPSIFNIRFLSGADEAKDGSEYGKYLGMVQDGSDAYMYLAEGAAYLNLAAPQNQWVITDVDGKDITFANRENPSQSIVAQLRKTDKTNVYELTTDNSGDFGWGLLSYAVGYYIQNVTGGLAGLVNERGGSLKVQLTPTTIDEKAGIADYSKFELSQPLALQFAVTDNLVASNIYVALGAENTGLYDLAGSQKAGKAIQWDVVKNTAANDSIYSTLTYAIQATVNKEVVVKEDKMVDKAFATYKFTTAINGHTYYLTDTYELSPEGTDASNFLIKENVNGTVSIVVANDPEYNGNMDHDTDALAFAAAGGLGVSNAVIANTGDILLPSIVMSEPTPSLESVARHASFKHVNGGFLAVGADRGAVIAATADEAANLTFWLDTVDVEEPVPAFYISQSPSVLKADAEVRNYLWNPTDSAYYFDNKSASYVSNPEYYQNNDVIYGDMKAVFKSATADDVDGDDAYKFQIVLADADVDDEYVVRSVVDGTFLTNTNGKVYLTEDPDVAMVVTIGEGDPTANEAIAAESGVQVIGGEGVVTVQGAAGKVITVANILGQTIANQVAASDNVTIAAPAGVVVVAVDGEATKVVVK